MHSLVGPRRWIIPLFERSAPFLQFGFLPLEHFLAGRAGTAELEENPPLFIIGPPRSGTTLLYCVLTSYYRLAYISNFSEHYFRTPVVGAMLERLLEVPAGKSGYHFEYGYISGPGAPHEAGRFWAEIFPASGKGYVARGTTPAARLQQLRAATAGITRIYKAPVITKSVNNSLRISPIMEALPEARFIVCHRDMTENAISILKARKARNALQTVPDAWWSAEPVETAQLKGKSLAYQAAAQVFYIHRQIAADRARFGTERFVEVNYESFCADVGGVLRQINAFMAAAGCQLSVAGEVPGTFPVHHDKTVSTDERREIAATLHTLHRLT